MEAPKRSFEDLLDDLGRQVVNVVVKLGHGSCSICHVLGHSVDGLKQNLGLVVECSRSLGITSQRVCNLLVLLEWAPTREVFPLTWFCWSRASEAASELS
jgi:hypothetical protein